MQKICLLSKLQASTLEVISSHSEADRNMWIWCFKLVLLLLSDTLVIYFEKFMFIPISFMIIKDNLLSLLELQKKKKVKKKKKDKGMKEGRNH